MQDVLQAYVSAWAEEDDTKRLELLEQAWTDDGVYQDPMADVQGRAALVAHIGGFHDAMPGAKIEMTGDASHHHGNVYFAWQITGPDGSVMVSGVDFGILAPDGRLARITGFFGPPGS